MRMGVLGAGAGGAAATVELSLADHEVVLWSRSPTTLQPFLAAGGIQYEGVLGKGIARPALMTTALSEVISEADGLLVCVPTSSHGAVARALLEAALPRDLPVVLDPGHTGGALEFSHVFEVARAEPPPLAEFSTLTYVARKYEPQQVTVSGRAKQIRIAALPGGEKALTLARRLFASAMPVQDVLNSSLSNVNVVLHPPGAILAAAWIEARQGDFTFYVDGMTPGVARVMDALDQERRSVARAFNHDLPPLIAEMRAIGTVEDAARIDDLVGAISDGVANRRIKAPESLEHRYYLEDFGYGLVPLLALAEIARVPAPVAQSLLRVGSTLTGIDFGSTGRTAERMGISGLGVSQLLARVRGG